MLKGRTLSRREHNLLVRVLADLSRLIPLSFFVIVPFMEFALPFALKLFPNLLPSTFEEKHQKDEKRKQLLKVRLEVVEVLEHTLQARSKDIKQRGESAAPAAAASGVGAASGSSRPVREFIQRMKDGEKATSVDELISVMKKFKDDITLDALSRDQLVSMSQFMGVPSFAPTALLRFQLRTALRKLRNEDKEIMWEGVDTLSQKELQADLRARGLPTLGLTHSQLRESLRDWILLSNQKEIPYSLLILTNMLRFAETRSHYQRRKDQVTKQSEEAELLDAAQNAMCSISEGAIVKALDESKESAPTAQEALELLRREEELVEEERQVQASMEDDVLSESEEEKAAQSERLSKMAPLLDADAVEAAHEERLSREQLGDIAEAVDIMSGTSATAREKEEMQQLEREREAAREEVEAAIQESSDLKALDSSVRRMIEKLREDCAQTDKDLGQTLRSLDLDDDGFMNIEELQAAMEHLSQGKRPDKKAFKKLLAKLDNDGDGQISVKEWRLFMEDMQMTRKDEDEEGEPPAEQRAKASA